MSFSSKDVLNGCLYFKANSLARVISRMADEEFGKLGMTPSHAFLLMVAVDEPGISQKELAGKLHLAQSTVSRFVDTLVLREFVKKKAVGKLAHVYPTEKGIQQMGDIQSAWKGLYRRYSQILGKEEAKALTCMIDGACKKLEG